MGDIILQIDYTVERAPPSNRRGKVDGVMERHLTEAAVMVAMAEWLFFQGAVEARMSPDGMHLKRFDLPAFLRSRRFEHVETTGRTGTGGLWRRGDQSLEVYPRPGLGDVVGVVDGRTIEVEAKGGVVNTSHPGQRSKLRRRLCEAVGQLMATPRGEARHIAAVPRHPETEALSHRMAARCREAGVEIALVSADGTVDLVPAEAHV